MGISAATVESAIARMQKHMEELGPALERLRQKVNKEIEKQPWPVSATYRWAWDKLINLVQKIREKVAEMLANSRVPFIFDEHEDRWLKIGGDAVEASSTIQDSVNKNGKRVWGGLAGGAYQEGVKQQPVAMDAIVDKANTIAEACTSVRNAGYVFYIGMAAAVVAAVVAIATAGAVAPAIAALIAAIVAIAVAVGWRSSVPPIPRPRRGLGASRSRRTWRSVTKPRA